jgi:hypothetical protein
VAEAPHSRIKHGLRKAFAAHIAKSFTKHIAQEISMFSFHTVLSAPSMKYIFGGAMDIRCTGDPASIVTKAGLTK